MMITFFAGPRRSILASVMPPGFQLGKVRTAAASALCLRNSRRFMGLLQMEMGFPERRAYITQDRISQRCPLSRCEGLPNAALSLPNESLKPGSGTTISIFLILRQNVTILGVDNKLIDLAQSL